MNGMGVLQIVYKRREQQLRQQIGKSTRCEREVFTPMLETEEWESIWVQIDLTKKKEM